MSRSSSESVYYFLDTTTYTLFYYGNGAMPSDFDDNAQPWYSYRSTIEEIIIVNGITRIGNNAFIGMSNLKELLIPEGVESIGEYAISELTLLKTLVIPNTIMEI